MMMMLSSIMRMMTKSFEMKFTNEMNFLDKCNYESYESMKYRGGWSNGGMERAATRVAFFAQPVNNNVIWSTPLMTRLLSINMIDIENIINTAPKTTIQRKTKHTWAFASITHCHIHEEKQDNDFMSFWISRLLDFCIFFGFLAISWEPKELPEIRGCQINWIP